MQKDQTSEDAMSWKRLLIRVGVVGVALAALIAAVAFWPRGLAVAELVRVPT